MLLLLVWLVTVLCAVDAPPAHALSSLRRALYTAFPPVAQGILMVYDITNRHSFKSLDNWIKQIEQVRCEHTTTKWPYTLCCTVASLTTKRILCVRSPLPPSLAVW